MPTIMIRHATDEEVEAAKLITGDKSAAQAFVRCVHLAASRQQRIDLLIQQMTEMRRRLDVAEQVIERARESASALLVHVAQGDMLNV